MNTDTYVIEWFQYDVRLQQHFIRLLPFPPLFITPSLLLPRLQNHVPLLRRVVSRRMHLLLLHFWPVVHRTDTARVKKKEQHE